MEMTRCTRFAEQSRARILPTQIRFPEPPRNFDVTTPDGSERKGQRAMSKFPIYGLCAGAALYAAVGILGLLVVMTQPNIAASADGYGTQINK